ncbi:hypothetical protein CEXT_714191 [Caerostris extrusa]|uniref:Uncharacterized protein n=1 Tax=Caerostris extrusa TaxID=172846 RepID=A0AAV4N5I8_CAEEX|nr:hypothetical protein CEXT_714191 [Caerostris extrusa]
MFKPGTPREAKAKPPSPKPGGREELTQGGPVAAVYVEGQLALEDVGALAVVEHQAVGTDALPHRPVLALVVHVAVALVGVEQVAGVGTGLLTTTCKQKGGVTAQVRRTVFLLTPGLILR